MSQVTNLNVAPYFDDFNANNDYYRVLFKPGYPVQARELTTLQSILQNQIEKFGQHFFKEGAKVIPGNTTYNPAYYAVQINNTYQGVPVEAYISQLVGVKITGQTSGVTAIVDKVLFATDSERGNTTLYVNYLTSNIQNNSSQTFLDGESLITSVPINTTLLGNNVIAQNEPFAITVASNATATGSAFSISNGVYFVRGNFVNVLNETLILDQYTNTPNYRIGLFVSEQIITSDIDETLADNSQGFNNYAAPGADRLKISVRLFKKNLNDRDDTNFVELATIVNGVLKSQIREPQYSLITEELARRTYAESGDYVVNPFDISIKESLNDGIGNRGVFSQGQFTYSGSTPSESLSVCQISPGKAFVRGYEIETISPNFVDVPKPRTTKTLTQQAINYNTGSTLALNRVYGAPVVGFGNTYVLRLRDERVGSSRISEPGKEIGVARVYDFRLEAGTYNTSNTNTNQWNISLYDVQTITEITVNEPVTLSVPTFVKGDNSGATAFLKDSVNNSTSLTIYQKEGDFIVNEALIFDGQLNSRIAIAITSYGIDDVKSVFGSVGSASTFSADIIQSDLSYIGVATISAADGVSGISTIRSTNSSFPKVVKKVGNIVQYSDPNYSDPVLAKVVGIGATHLDVVGVTGVVGVATGKLPTTTLQVTDLRLVTSKTQGSLDDTLYTVLPKKDIAEVNLLDSNITIRKSFTVNISGNRLTSSVSAGTNEVFLPFDEERYALIRSDGSTENLTSDKFAFENGGNQLQIYNLGSNDTGATLITTIKKSGVKAKVKRKNRVNSVIVDKSIYEYSGVGATTLNDGLVFGNFPYGTRVQDSQISLNTADVIDVHGIFESLDTSDPSAPTMTLTNITGPSTKTTELIIGEKITGQNSGAIAVCAEKVSDSTISFIQKNQSTFKEGEVVRFEESGVEATITLLESSSFNVSSNYTFSNGQEGTFYGYGYISRNANASEANKKLKVYFTSGYYDSTDDGDITTVESYNTFNFGKEIQKVNGHRTTDLIDIRPVVSNYTAAEGTRSPLEFYGRTFSGSGNSASNILASDESILIDFSFYLGRIDRLYLDKSGKFQIKYGTPAERPEKPVSVDNALELAVINLPAYLYDVSHASVEFLEHKRYRMSDIKQLENRIKSLEYYTTLSLLESDTANLFIPDADGLNKFKSGFFVDNFSSILPQEDAIEQKNSLDLRNNVLRPSHYTNSIDLIAGPVEGVDLNADLAFEQVEGINIRKTGDIVTLDYAEVEWLNQPVATRSESVTPFMVSFWQGTMELNPSSDTWVDTVRLNPKIINVEGNYAETLAHAARTLNIDPQTGLGPTLWGSWETVWTGRDVWEGTRERTTNTSQTNVIGVQGWEGVLDNGAHGPVVERTFTTTIQERVREVRNTGTTSRSGSRTVVAEQFDNVSQGDRVLSRNLVPFMRSRNIEFVGKRFKPLTQLYGFFDGVDVTRFCVPKLLEISMISGSFEVGESVIGVSQNSGFAPNSSPQSNARITFRVAQSNHKEGPYNAPTSTFPFNPYNSEILSASYSSTSSILNIDTFSLANQPQGTFSGWVETDMILTGQSSGAQARITNVRLISDLSATVIGCLFLPDPNLDVHPRFETGKKVFTLTNSNINDRNNATTLADETFSAEGTLETVQEEIISTRNARIETQQTFESREVFDTTGTQVISSQVLSQVETSRRQVGWVDPLAQSIFVDDETGVFLTRCDVFFRSKDDSDIPVTLQIRTVELGTPTTKVLPFSEVVLDPSQVNISGDVTAATSFQFKAPVYLEGGKEYAIALLSNSTKYSVYISRVGEVDLLTDTFISNQPYLGSLFKSQNASTWEPSQWEDLKFVLYRADFITSGTLEYYNPVLSEGNKQIPTLLPNSLNIQSKQVRVGLGSTLVDGGLTLGNTIIQDGTNASADYIGNAGIATGTLRVINAGIGYTPSASSLTFSNVPLTSITGTGRNALADITVQNGSIVSIGVTITSGGSGYRVGDIVGVTSIGSIPTGTNARFSIVSIASTNELVLDNVQGNFQVGAGYTVRYINNSGITTELNYASGGNVTINEIVQATDGLHFRVDHKNHGMYFDQNYVTISGAQSDVSATRLTNAYNSDSTDAIIVNNASQFSTFEGVGIGTTNPGYLLIGDEVIEYTAVTGNSIGGNIVREYNGVVATNYPAGTPVYKYEMGGISLNRINKTHYLGDALVTDPIGFDYYTIKVDTSTNGIDRSSDSPFPQLHFNSTKSTGGYFTKATQNMPYEIITPMVQNLTVPGTTVSAQIRTITGSSISGNEIPFVDNGFESVSINKTNYLDSPRIIASDVNEQAYLDNLPGNKSFNMRLFLETNDSRVSPVVDTQRVSTILTSNRVNSVITDFATDSRVASLTEDPSAFQYISREISLQNPATSIQIILNSHINEYSDIRAFYAISENPGFNPIFVPFPGYLNLNSRGQIIDPENSDGRPDKYINPVNVRGFLASQSKSQEYTFTIDQLPAFKSFRVKLVLTSTNQVYVPKVKDLRVIALA